MNGFSSSACCPIRPAHDFILRLAAQLELPSEQVPLALGELSDWVDLADSVARQGMRHFAWPRRRSAGQQLSHRPRARSNGQSRITSAADEAAGTDPSLELRAATPDLVRPLQRQQPMWRWTDRCGSRHVCVSKTGVRRAHTGLRYASTDDRDDE